MVFLIETTLKSLPQNDTIQLDFEKGETTMGCLFEFVFELVFELIYIGYVELMSLIVPKRTYSEARKSKIKRGIKIYASVLLIVLVLSVIMYIQADSVISRVGQVLTWMTLTVMGVQIIAGIILRIFVRK
jgi:hypothetical protein